MLDHSQSCAGFQRRYAYTCVGCQAYREVSNAVHIPGVSGLTWAEVRTLRSSSNHGGPEKATIPGRRPSPDQCGHARLIYRPRLTATW